jgi:tRNA threonylcarbamoyladenosine biosynthesis protein TsaB
MNILAIETSGEAGSLALLHRGHLLERSLDGVANHSEGVLPAILSLLAEAGLSPAQLDALAFGSGPGAFTGLRLACGVAQGLALGAGIGLVPISSLAALAAQSTEDRVFAACDARMGEIYHCAYTRDPHGRLQAAGEPGCCAPDRLVLPEGRWFGIGSAFAVHGDALAAGMAGRLSGCRADAVPRAADVAVLAIECVERGELLAPHQALPLYVRDKVAFTTAERLARGGRG